MKQYINWEDEQVKLRSAIFLCSSVRSFCEMKRRRNLVNPIFRPARLARQLKKKQVNPLLTRGKKQTAAEVEMGAWHAQDKGLQTWADCKQPKPRAYWKYDSNSDKKDTATSSEYHSLLLVSGISDRLTDGQTSRSNKLISVSFSVFFVALILVQVLRPLKKANPTEKKSLQLRQLVWDKPVWWFDLQNELSCTFRTKHGAKTVIIGYHFFVCSHFIKYCFFFFLQILLSVCKIFHLSWISRIPTTSTSCLFAIYWVFPWSKHEANKQLRFDHTLN